MKKYFLFYIIPVLFSFNLVQSMEVDKNDKCEFTPEFIAKAKSFLDTNKEELSDREKDDYLNALSLLAFCPNMDIFCNHDQFLPFFSWEKTPHLNATGLCVKKDNLQKQLELEINAPVNQKSKTYREMLTDVFLKGYPLPDAIWNYTDVTIPYGYQNTLARENKENIKQKYEGHSENFYTIKAKNGYEFHVAKTLLNMRWKEFVQKHTDFVENSGNQKNDRNCITIFEDQDGQVVESLIEKSVYERIDSENHLPVIIAMMKMLDMLKEDRYYSICLKNLADHVFSAKVEYALESAKDIFDLLLSRKVFFHKALDKELKVTVDTSVESLLSLDDKNYFIQDGKLIKLLEGESPNNIEENKKFKYYELDDKEEQIKCKYGKYRKVTKKDVSEMLAEKLIEPFFKTPAIFKKATKSSPANKSKAEYIDYFNQESLKAGISIHKILEEKRKNLILSDIVGYPFEYGASKKQIKDKT